MDFLIYFVINNIYFIVLISQLQAIVGDDICKQSTAFFYQHNKIIANGGFSSPLESLQVENDYLKKVERIMNEEKCFKTMWVCIFKFVYVPNQHSLKRWEGDYA